MWWLPLVGLLIGLVLGVALTVTVPAEFASYSAVGILVALDSVLGALRAELDGEFETTLFVTGFLLNLVLAGGLTFLGDRLGVDLYVAAIVAFGVRMFDNLARIRRTLLQRLGWAREAQGASSD